MKRKFKQRHVRRNGRILASKRFPLETSERVIDKWRQEVLAKSLIGISSKKAMRLETFVDRFFQMKKLHTDNEYSTVHKQAGDIRNHILPYFGSFPMNEITTSALIDWQADIIKDEDINPDGVMPNTYKNIHSTFKQLMTYAIIDGHIQMNPVTALPRIKVDPTKFNFWTQRQSSRFLLECQTIDWNVFQVTCLALHCGARPGELRGLLRKDLDWQEGTVHIRRTWCTKKNELKHKTKNGLDRIVSLPDAVLRALHNKYPLDPDDQVFPFLSNGWGWRNFRPVQLEVNEKLQDEGFETLPYLRLHDCRHSFASQLAMSRQRSVQEIKALMGHKKLSSTEIYMHLTRDFLKGATDILTEGAGWMLPPGRPENVIQFPG